eukprot:TRINITY_DN29088_c0_g1_i1.p1 TRINITY_DN29088_c0_g1~~TRINITY_DN29088_c0_g1_i1.p1  ORF type:complete len:523 (+),score=24.58 TRINITY_DN29088_c0_g1_i1:49-1617(+)
MGFLAPFSLVLLSPWCSDRGFPVISKQFVSTSGEPVEMLSRRSYMAAGGVACSNRSTHTVKRFNQHSLYGPLHVIDNGRVVPSMASHDGGRLRGLEVSAEYNFVKFAWEVKGSSTAYLQYSMSLLPVSSLATGKMGISGHGHSGVAHGTVVGVSVSFGDPLRPFALSGVAFAPRFSILFRFDCDAMRSSSYQFVVKLQFDDTQTGTSFDPMMVPFTKLCGPSSSWLNDSFGTSDDMGHVGGSLPLAIYNLLFLLSVLTSTNRCRTESTHGRVLDYCIQVMPTVVASSPEGTLGVPGGILETIMLLISGSLSAFHVFTLMHTHGSNRLHEMYHVLAHGFGLAMGMLSLTLRLLPSVIDVTFPIYIISIAAFFSLHSQRSMHSASLHQVFTAVMVCFGVCRLVAMYDARWALLSSFFGLWSSVLFMLSADGGVATEIQMGLDVASTGLLSGIFSIAVVAAFALCTTVWHGPRRQKTARDIWWSIMRAARRCNWCCPKNTDITAEYGQCECIEADVVGRPDTKVS